jgi:hypothetical protein
MIFVAVMAVGRMPGAVITHESAAAAAVVMMFGMNNGSQ